MISPSISLAIFRDMAVLPLAVGPRITISGFFAVLRKDFRSLVRFMAGF